MGTVLGGRYRIVEQLGRGGAGHVYRAIQEPLDREVALKVLRTDLAEEARKEYRARFLREAALAGRLQHPNVVRVFDFGTEIDGTSFVVMELLRGRPLSVVIQQGPMEWRRAVLVAQQVASGLRHAHQSGMIHRDVKPSNVLLVPTDDGDERAKLLDFGLVKSEDATDDSQLTRLGVYMGTPAYMAPEQARADGQADARADLYSLGCMLFKMLTGALPYAGKNALSVAIRHQTEPIPRMADLRPGIRMDPALEDIVRRLMQKDPADRYQTAGEVVEALENWLYPPLVVEPLPPPRGWLWLAGGATVAGLLGVGLVGLLAAAAGLWLSRIDPVAAPVGTSPPTAEGLAFQAPDADPSRDDEVSAPPAPEPVRVAPQPVPPAPEPVPIAPKPAPVAPEPVRVAPQPAPRPSPVTPKPVPPAPEVASAVPKPVPPAPELAPSAPVPSLSVDGVYFSPGHAERALAFVNTATETELRRAGMYGRAVTIVLEKRPFPSLAAFGTTPYIGEKTVQAVARATEN